MKTPSLTPMEDAVREQHAQQQLPDDIMQARVIRAMRGYSIEIAKMMDAGCPASDFVLFSQSIAASALSSCAQNIVSNGHARNGADYHSLASAMLRNVARIVEKDKPFYATHVRDTGPEAGRA